MCVCMSTCVCVYEYMCVCVVCVFAPAEQGLPSATVGHTELQEPRCLGVIWHHRGVSCTRARENRSVFVQYTYQHIRAIGDKGLRPASMDCVACVACVA